MLCLAVLLVQFLLLLLCYDTEVVHLSFSTTLSFLQLVLLQGDVPTGLEIALRLLTFAGVLKCLLGIFPISPSILFVSIVRSLHDAAQFQIPTGFFHKILLKLLLPLLPKMRWLSHLRNFSCIRKNNLQNRHHIIAIE